MNEEHPPVYTMDGAFSRWAAEHRKAMGWELQYEEKYDLARAAFEGGYQQAVKDYKFFEGMK